MSSDLESFFIVHLMSIYKRTHYTWC